MWEALRVAQAADFVSAMPGGLEARIEQGGTNVSGGQRQRLSIARALIRKPEIYLFDDSFSALDLATDARLRLALEPYTADAAVVIVAQRVSTITAADEILVLEDGELVGRGTHEELLETCPTYAEIVQSQIGERSAHGDERASAVSARRPLVRTAPRRADGDDGDERRRDDPQRRRRPAADRALERRRDPDGALGEVRRVGAPAVRRARPGAAHGWRSSPSAPSAASPST